MTIKQVPLSIPRSPSQAPPLLLIETIEDIRRFTAEARADGKTIAFVPTMGALHDGHLSLIRLGLEKADIVVSSIFVNPRQFGPNEDLDAYPRQLEKDQDLLNQAGASALFYPKVQDIYPEGYATNIHVSGVGEGLCGKDRPGHFDGVATVVTKLLIQVNPDIAIFGEKDYQQLCLIRRLAIDLNLPCEIIGGPIIRDPDGLALSSRNAYLDESEIKIARQFNKILRQACHEIATGTTPSIAIEHATSKLLNTGVSGVDYLELREDNSLQPLQSFTKDNQARLIAAIRVGRARLLDNISIDI